MEDDKKKKRNKKKKNKHNNKGQEAAHQGEEAASVNAVHAGNGRTHENGDTQNAEMSLGNQVNDITEPARPIDTEKDQVQQSEPNVEETSKRLHAEIDSYISEKAGLEDTIKNLEEEKKSYLHKESMLEETISKLQDESKLHLLNQANSEETIKKLEAQTVSYLSKEAAFEQRIRHLQEENASLLHRQTTLEEAIIQLQDENNLHLHKKASQEEKMQQLEAPTDSFIAKEATEEEIMIQLQRENESSMHKQAILERQGMYAEANSLKEREVKLEASILELRKRNEELLQKENELKETTSSLNDENRALKLQVVELENSKCRLVEENQIPMSKVLSLQMQLKKPDSVASFAQPQDGHVKGTPATEDLNSEVEAAYSLINKLIAENAELVEKVSELCIKVDQQKMESSLLSATVNGYPSELSDNTATGSLPVSSNHESMAVHKLDSMEDIPINDEMFDRSEKEITAVNIVSTDSDSGMVLPSIDIDPEAKGMESEEERVPITDAPLIGAPFRLVSFVAKYVSGADLVEKSSLLARY